MSTKAVTMDAKEAGNIVFLVGQTRRELGGSHLSLVRDLSGGDVPTVDSIRAKQTFANMHAAISGRLVRACHDLSEGGLAVAAVEMAMAGGLGMRLDVADICSDALSPTEALFSESNTRFLVETRPESADEFERTLASGGVPVCRLGTIEASDQLVINCGQQTEVEVDLAVAKQVWQKPLDW